MYLKLIQLLAFFVTGIVFTYLCNILLLRFSKSLGIRNKNNVVIRWSQESKPSLGGVSFFIVFVFTAIGYSILFSGDDIFQNTAYVGLFATSSLAFLMGLTDDAYDTKPLIKLGAQILCGCILVWTGTIIDLFDNALLNQILTVIWVVLIMNSLNMLDNMDGITGTVVLFILITCLLSGWIVTEFNTSIWSITLMAMIGCIIGFLFHNIHPSKLFMGDAGSQFIGLFVAFFAIENLWNVGAITGTSSWTGVVVTLIAFTPAAADTLTVVINRLKKGKSPMVGGKDHTTHHLVYAGKNDKQVWIIFTIIAVLSTGLALVIIHLLSISISIPLLFFVAFFLLIFVLLYRNTILYSEPKEEE